MVLAPIQEQVKALPEAAARQDSVQVLPDAKTGANSSAFFEGAWMSERRATLGQVGTKQREYQLRALYHHQLNWMFQSAAAGMTKKWAAASFQILGKNRVDYFQDLLRHAQFNQGYARFMMELGLNYIRYDSGAWCEVIAPGDPLKPPTGPATGLAVLDTLKVTPTGDPDYPAIYSDRKGRDHLLHRTRVFQIVDSPDADEATPGYGKSALSRALAIVLQQLHMNGYVDAQLDELPPPGYIVASNINKTTKDMAVNAYVDSLNKDAPPVTGRTIWLYSVDPTAPADLKVITFQQAPPNWDYAKYTELHVNAIALAFGVDIQELWQLAGGNLGSAQQSNMLHAKSQGKMFGAFLTEFERVMNDILPRSLEFKFKVRDGQADQQMANTASMWGTFISQASTYLSTDEVRKMLATQVEAVRDAITDAAGNIQRLDDADPKDPGDQIASDATPNMPTTPAAQPAPAQPTQPAVKTLQATRLDFEDAFAALLKEQATGGVNRRRFGILGRSLIAKYGLKAQIDGLADGGVQVETLEGDDRQEYNTLLATQSGYVTALADRLYAAAKTKDTDPATWYSGSIQPFYMAGLLSADKNGMYQFVGDDGAESCSTCQRLKDQSHRLWAWRDKGLLPGPGNTNYECNGFKCAHMLKKTTGLARGRF